MQLVMASYDNKPKPLWEWECRKCMKIVAKHKLNETEPTGFEKFLSKWCDEDDKETNIK